MSVGLVVMPLMSGLAFNWSMPGFVRAIGENFYFQICQCFHVFKIKQPANLQLIL